MTGQVGLDRRRHHRALPFEDGRDRRSRSSCGSGWAPPPAPNARARPPAGGRGPCRGSTDRHRDRSTTSGRQVASAWPSGPARASVRDRCRPTAGRARHGVPGRRRTGATRPRCGRRPDAAPTGAEHRHDGHEPTDHGHDPVHAGSGPSMRASVSTMAISSGDSRCWTRNERVPTFHSATPRRSWGTSSASVDDKPEQRRRPVRPRRGLGVDDTCLGVGQKAPGQPDLLGPGRTGRRRGPTAGGAPPRSTRPRPDDSFHDDWSQRATARLARIAQASSTTTTTHRRCRRRTGRPSPACNHAVAHVMRIPRAAEW